jgi:hypothetical protein
MLLRGNSDFLSVLTESNGPTFPKSSRQLKIKAIADEHRAPGKIQNGTPLSIAWNFAVNKLCKQDLIASNA